MNPHNSMTHFEFTDINNMLLKNGGTRAAPRSKRNVRYVAPRDLPMSTFGGTSLHHGTATLDLPPHMFGSVRANPHCHCAGTGGHCMGTAGHCPSHRGGLGEITSGEGLFLGASAPVIVAATAGIYAVGGMFSAWSQEFFIGNKRSLPYSTIAKRNAILGGVFGLITVGALTASLAKN